MSDTPMMQQYKRLKQKAKDAVLFFRLGDFYEMFQDDAREVSSLLNLTLTKRNNVPMCGIPYHAAKSYINRLLQAGKKIAICEQITLPTDGRKIADREIVEILTPGTLQDEEYLDGRSNNYLVALARTGDSLSLSYVDSSTGAFYATAFPLQELKEKVRETFARLRPREIVIQESLFEEENDIEKIVSEYDELLVNRFPDWSFDQYNTVTLLKQQLGVLNLKGYGIEEDDPALLTTGVLLEYLQENSKSTMPHIQDLVRYYEGDFLTIDEWTQKNLELTQNMFDGSKRYTLLEVLDYTKTSPGARKLKHWIVHPLQESGGIGERQRRVTILYRNQMLLSTLRELLGSILDLERLATRVAMDKANAKDMLAIKNSLQTCFSIIEALKEWNLYEQFRSEKQSHEERLHRAAELLQNAIAEEPSTVLNEGNLIKKGYSQDLDKLRELKENSRKIVDNYLHQEKAETGINSLKIKYNKIIGYFLEVTKANLDLVPDHFIRRQSLVNSERFTTEKLIELETNLNNATEKSIELERELFIEIRETIKEYASDFYTTAAFLSDLDCFCSFAHAATLHGYVCPDVNTSEKLHIEEGRHPVVEYHMAAGEFIPNAIHLDTKKTSFALITGPNMSGKSTFLRQTALIVVMAQIGSFVPSESASIGIVDRIFCRVGATDNLARGESTFLVEMNEAAHILRTATPKSLIIMDEIGRGTSTNDGLALAWSITEHLLSKVGAKTLFATHFHELTNLEHENLTNLYLDILEEGNRIIFLKKVKPGSSSNSYGIHVAKLAGIPEEIVARAEELLSSLTGEPDSEQKKLQKQKSQERKSDSPPQLPDTDEYMKEKESKQGQLFSDAEHLTRKLAAIDINTMTPLEALNTLAALQKEITKNKAS
jgi:DNA mismatch repair protein MutS